MLSQKLITRPDFTRLPDLPLPFYVRSMGHYVMGADYKSSGPVRECFVQVWWGCSGEGKIRVDEEVCVLGPGCVVYKLPSEHHAYRPRSGRWEFRWFTFDGPGAEAFMRGYGFPRLLTGAGACPNGLFLEIEQGLQEMSPYSQRNLIATAARILALAGGRQTADSGPGRTVNLFIELVQNEYGDSAVNVNRLADKIGIHRSTLSRLFKEKMLISPGEYLVRFRVQRALSLLRESDRPVSEVAAMVGIPEPGYFCQTIRRTIGMSPSNYRAQAHAGW